MPEPSVARQLLLPELRLLKTRRGARGGLDLVVEKTSRHEVCPRCASLSSSVYDRRLVTIRDEPVRRAEFRLIIVKRRFSCRPCRRPFTEPVDGIRKGYRTTQRYRQAVWDAAEEFVDLKLVRKRMRCSSGLVQRIVYEQLELRRRTHCGHPHAGRANTRGGEVRSAARREERAVARRPLRTAAGS